jgi:MFS family permease
MLSDLYPKDRLGRAIAIFQSGSLIGTTIAFAAGGALVALAEPSGALRLPYFGETRVWQVIFLVIGAPGVVLAFFTLAISEPVRKTEKGNQSTWKDFFAFLGDHRLLFTGVIGGVAVVALVSYSWMAWIPALLIRERGISAGTAGLVMALASGLCGMAGYLLGGLGSDALLRRGVNDAHMRISCIASVAAVPMALIFFAIDSLALSIFAACVLCCLIAMPITPTVTALQLATPPHMRGRISALYITSVTAIGIGFGPVLVPLLSKVLPAGDLRASLLTTMMIGLPAAAWLFHIARKPFAEIMDR